jgi:hypothetical protein
MGVYFKEGIPSDRVASIVNDMEQTISAHYPLIKRIFIEAVPAGQDAGHGLQS